MKITIDKEKNTIFFSSEENVFDNDILYKTVENLKKLNQKNLYVECSGFIPAELIIYLSEVSNHCEMNILFNDDMDSKKFLSYLTPNSKINFINKEK